MVEFTLEHAPTGSQSLSSEQLPPLQGVWSPSHALWLFAPSMYL